MSILPQLLVNALITGSLYALVSVGLSLTYSTFGIINFAHGHLLMVGAYIFYFFISFMPWGSWICGAASIAVTIALAPLILKTFVTPFRRLNPILPFVTTLALSIMLESLVAMIAGVDVKSISVGGFEEPLSFYSVYVTRTQVVLIVMTILLLSGCAALLHNTSLGRVLTGMFQSEQYAQAVGARTTRISHISFAGSLALATLAGIFLGFETNLQPTMGTSLALKGFASMILGGLGNLWGALAGAFVLALVEHLSIGLDFGSFSIPAGYKDGFAFLVILFVLLFRPEGIFTKGRRKI